MLKYLFAFFFCFSTCASFGQYITLDSIMPAEADLNNFRSILYYARKNHSSKRKFQEYCEHYYAFNFYPDQPIVLLSPPELVKKFKIPVQERSAFYPFDTYDSIQFIFFNTKDIGEKVSFGLDTIVLDKKAKEILSDVLFNYVYNDKLWLYYVGINNEDYRKKLRYKLEFFDTKTGKSRYISCFKGGYGLTNFNHYEQHLLDFQWDKMPKFMENMKIGSDIWYSHDY